MKTEFISGSFAAAHSIRSIPLSFSLLSAGDPAEATDDYELLDVNELITGGKEGFVAYRVTGESMCDEIKPNYIVFVEPYQEPKKGDIVVARVNGRNNIKIYEPKPSGLYLVPKNKKFPVQKISVKDDFMILGVVRGHLAVY